MRSSITPKLAPRTALGGLCLDSFLGAAQVFWGDGRQQLGQAFQGPGLCRGAWQSGRSPHRLHPGSGSGPRGLCRDPHRIKSNIRHISYCSPFNGFTLLLSMLLKLSNFEGHALKKCIPVGVIKTRIS